MEVNARLGWFADNGTKPTIELSYIGTHYGRLYIGGDWDFNIQNPGVNKLLRLRSTGISGHIILSPGGNVGIGTTDPDDELHVMGGVSATDFTTTTSDVRLKRNIAPLTGALDRVKQLRGVSFDWDVAANPRLKLSAGRKIGFVAQEVASVLPDVVSEVRFRFRGEDGNVVSDETYSGIAYSQLIPVLVEAIKEQQAIIDSQKNRIDRIEAALLAAGILRQE